MTLPFDLSTLFIAALAVCAAYTVFGITAFGAALVSVPVLSHFYPLDFVLPMCTMLDVSAALAMGTRVSREADLRELKWLAPMAVLGAVLGVTLLVSLPRQATLAAFGTFLLVYGIYMLRQGGGPGVRVSRGWGPVAGIVGGTMGTLFGAAGPAYAIYLSRRLPDKHQLRTTLSTMVLISTTSRALVFAVGGLLLADRLLMYVILLPFALLGFWIGSRLHGRISRDQVLRLMSVLLLLMGISLLKRAYSS